MPLSSSTRLDQRKGEKKEGDARGYLELCKKRGGKNGGGSVDALRKRKGESEK